MKGSDAVSECTVKRVEAEHAQRCLELDFARGEPVEPLATVEQKLQRANAEAQRRKAEPIQSSGQGPIGAPPEKQKNAEPAQHAKRQVDIKHPAPAVGVRGASHRVSAREWARASRQARIPPSPGPAAPADTRRAARIATTAPAARQKCPVAAGTPPFAPAKPRPHTASRSR